MRIRGEDRNGGKECTSVVKWVGAKVEVAPHTALEAGGIRALSSCTTLSRPLQAAHESDVRPSLIHCQA